MRRILRSDDPDVDVYPLLTALVLPRPIAWISTVSADGTGNLAPHSFFSVACANPPIVCFTSVGRKNTLANVLATGELVVNLADLAHLEQVNDSSARFDADVDEAAALGVVMEPSAHVRPPRVAGSPASLECTLHSTLDLGDSVLVLADVVATTIDERVLVDDHPQHHLLAPVARLGRDEWALPGGEVRSVARPRRPEDVSS